MSLNLQASKLHVQYLITKKERKNNENSIVTIVYGAKLLVALNFRTSLNIWYSKLKFHKGP